MLSHHIDYIPKDKCSCGAENARFDYVPDTIFGLSIKMACCIHDDRYSRGGNESDRGDADEEFLHNLLTIIHSFDKWYYPHWLARHRAMTYYDAVVRYGAGSFNYTEEVL